MVYITHMKNTYKWYQLDTEGMPSFDVRMMFTLIAVVGTMNFLCARLAWLYLSNAHLS